MYSLQPVCRAVSHRSARHVRGHRWEEEAWRPSHGHRRQESKGFLERFLSGEGFGPESSTEVGREGRPAPQRTALALDLPSGLDLQTRLRGLAAQPCVRGYELAALSPSPGEGAVSYTH